MPFDKLEYPEEQWEERRKGVRESLRAISIAELTDILTKHEEEFMGNPWRDEFVRLMSEQPHASFYFAQPQQDAVVYYCRDTDFGVWVVPNSGIGALDATGKRLMKEAIENPLSRGKIGGTK